MVHFGDESVECYDRDSHTKYKWEKSGRLIVVITILSWLGLLLPYVVAVTVKSVPPILPLISQSGGFPPMNGLFAIPMTVASCFAFVTFPLLYESINHRNINKDKRIKIMNKIALFIIILSFVGGIIAITCPVGYTHVPNKLEWIFTVFLVHGTGASFALVGTAFYNFCITGIWFLLPDVTKTAKYCKLLITIGFIMLLVIIAKPMMDYIYEELGPEIFNVKLLRASTYEMKFVYTTNYLISSFCEWALYILITISFISFFNDLQRISFSVEIRRKANSSSIDAIHLETITNSGAHRKTFCGVAEKKKAQ